jgi:hypothetical protein
MVYLLRVVTVGNFLLNLRLLSLADGLQSILGYLLRVVTSTTVCLSLIGISSPCCVTVLQLTFYRIEQSDVSLFQEKGCK